MQFLHQVTYPRRPRSGSLLCHCEERSDAVAQPFATKERYGCGVPLAGIAGAISFVIVKPVRTPVVAISCCRFVRTR